MTSEFEPIHQSIAWLFIPVFGHLCLVQFLFIMVSFKRWQATRQDDFRLNSLARVGEEPERSRRWAKNLDNQFQLPVLFYVVVALMVMWVVGSPSLATIPVSFIILAWFFLIGRVVHSIVQITGDNVRLRGYVFTINWAALSLMWLQFFSHIWINP